MRKSPTTPPNLVGEAVFDKSGKYRYSLSRVWDSRRGKAVFIMLNPSSADAKVNDPTIARCISFAQKMDCGSLEVVNLFAFRTAYPQELRHCRRPVGKVNNRYIGAAVETASFVVVAWGNWGSLYGRSQEVLELIDFVEPDRSKRPLFCFGMTLKGQPRHPLFLPADNQLIEFPLQIELIQK